tara:strand:+ start:661 stop:2805 length:2145 start_codon:yes stop_codon:yes gene_type:complete
MNTFQSFDLAKLRADAKISQEEMAAHLGVSQSQVSRYEQDQASAPYGIVVTWAEFCGQISTRRGVEYGVPYREIAAQLKLMRDYAETAPAPLDHSHFKNAPTAGNFLRQVRVLGRKPRVAICGRFDQGKSRLANTLMGSDALPTAYQPATAIISLVRHISARPSWLKEDVWVMGKGFDLNRADDQEHCNDFKIVAGSFDTLKQYGTHGEVQISDTEECFAALVFVDSPFLLGCDLLDLPGYGHSAEDHGKTELAHSLADVLIYTSSAQGFMDQQDLQFVNALLKQLPIIEAHDSLPPMRNVFFVATMARQELGELEDIITKASSRAYKHLLEGLKGRNEEITLADFRARFFTYLVDDPSRRQIFEDDLVDLLSKVLPTQVRHRLDKWVLELKNSAKGYCDSWSSRLVDALENQERAQGSLELLERAEPLRQRRLGEKTDRVKAIIAESKAASSDFVKTSLSKLVNPDYVEKIIRDRYEDKKEAQDLAGSYFVDHIQNKLNAFLTERTQELIPEIDDILAEYPAAGASADGKTVGQTIVPFDAQGAFLGGLTGGAVGAMAVWAASTTTTTLASSALGAGAVGFSASSVGVMSTGGVVAALGGPITIAVGLAVAVGLAAYALFGASWQGRLAKKICKIIKERQLLDILMQHSENYWDDTNRAFGQGMTAAEQSFQENLGNLRKLVNAESRDEITAMIAQVGVTRDFFGGIPWRQGN